MTAKPKIDKQLAPLVELCRALAPKDARLVREVAQSVVDPGAWIAKHKDQYDEPFASMCWRALAIGLTRARLCVSIDWKHEPADALAQLEQLRTAPAALERAALDIGALDTGQFLETLGGLLRETSDMTLASIDTVSDSYALILIPTKAAKTLQALAKRAGGQIDLFTGAEMKTFTRARKKRESRDDERWYREQPHFIRGTGRETEVTHLQFRPLGFMLHRHLMVNGCTLIKAPTFDDADTRDRAMEAEMASLTRDGWRRVRRTDYIDAFRRAKKP